MNYCEKLDEYNEKIFEKVRIRNNKLIKDLCSLLAINNCTYGIDNEHWHKIEKINDNNLLWYFGVCCHTRKETLRTHNIDRLKIKIYYPAQNKTKIFLEPKSGYDTIKIFNALIDLVVELEAEEEKAEQKKQNQKIANEMHDKLKYAFPKNSIEVLDNMFRLNLELDERNLRFVCSKLIDNFGENKK